MLTRDIAEGLYELAFSPRRQAVFVAASGGRAGTGGQVLRLDPGTLEITGRCPLPGRGFGLALDDAAGRLYVGDGAGGTVTAVDTGTLTITGEALLVPETPEVDGPGRRPFTLRKLQVDPARRRLYVGAVSFTDSCLHVLDISGAVPAPLAVIPGFGFVLCGLAQPDPGGPLYASNAAGMLFHVDPDRLRISARLQTPGDQLLNLAAGPGGGSVFATDQGHAFFDTLWSRHLPEYRKQGPGNQVLMLDPQTGAALARAPAGEGPLDLLHDAARGRLYVSCRGAGALRVFDSQSLAVLDEVSIGGHPNSLAINPADGAICLTVKAGEGQPEGTMDRVVRIALP